MRMPLTRQITGLSQARIGAHHVVEQAHVLPVFLRVAGVVLGVFLGVAAGAEGLVAGAGEDDAVDVARVRRRAEREDHALHHVGRVGVVLRRVVERDPGVVEAGHGLAVGRRRGPLLVADAGLGEVVDEVVVLEFAHGGEGVGSVHAVCPQAAGTSTARFLISWWWTAAKTRLMSSSGCVSTNGLIATLPSSTRSSAAGIVFGRAAPVADRARVERHQVRQAHLDLVHREADHRQRRAVHEQAVGGELARRRCPSIRR